MIRPFTIITIITVNFSSASNGTRVHNKGKSSDNIRNTKEKIKDILIIMEISICFHCVYISICKKR